MATSSQIILHFWLAAVSRKFMDEFEVFFIHTLGLQFIINIFSVFTDILALLWNVPNDTSWIIESKYGPCLA
jgi:hypothetical protein